MARGPSPEPAAACPATVLDVVDVEETGLRSFKQDALSRAPRLVEDPPCRTGEGQNLRRDLFQLGKERGAIHFIRADAAAKRVVMSEQPIDLRGQFGQIG